jgi:hypothetical protein
VKGGTSIAAVLAVAATALALGVPGARPALIAAGLAAYARVLALCLRGAPVAEDTPPPPARRAGGLGLLGGLAVLAGVEPGPAAVIACAAFALGVAAVAEAAGGARPGSFARGLLPLAAVAAGGALLLPAAARAALAASALFFVPGFAWSKALLPDRGVAERALWSVPLSFALVVPAVAWLDGAGLAVGPAALAGLGLALSAAGLAASRRDVRGAAVASVLALAALAGPAAATPLEGVAHTLLELRGPAGARIATGELAQWPEGERVTAQTRFRFGDGSTHEETAVFVAAPRPRLESYALRQAGPRFGGELEARFDRTSGRHSWRRTATGREPESGAGEIEIPDDAANGILFQALRHALMNGEEPSVSWVVFRPAPMVLRFGVTREAGAPVVVLGEERPTVHYVMRPALPFPLNWGATLAGVEPPELHVWMLPGPAPSFLRFAGPLMAGGPAWTIAPMAPRFAAPPR